jgi:hypothetical protein
MAALQAMGEWRGDFCGVTPGCYSLSHGSIYPGECDNDRDPATEKGLRADRATCLQEWA